MPTATDVIRLLNLHPHPIEGGHFRETWRSAAFIPTDAIPAHGGVRSAGTAIYYLLTGEAVSEMHKLTGDEVYHFYAGDPLEVLLLAAGEPPRVVTLGPDLDAGQVPQLVIPGGVWQGSVRGPGSHGYTLIGATMAPGFDYTDYTRGGRADLTEGWRGQEERITRRTPKG